MFRGTVITKVTSAYSKQKLLDVASKSMIRPMTEMDNYIYTSTVSNIINDKVDYYCIDYKKLGGINAFAPILNAKDIHNLEIKDNDIRTRERIYIPKVFSTNCKSKDKVSNKIVEEMADKYYCFDIFSHDSITYNPDKFRKFTIIERIKLKDKIFGKEITKELLSFRGKYENYKNDENDDIFYLYIFLLIFFVHFKK